MIISWANVIYRPNGFNITYSWRETNYTGVYHHDLYKEYDDQVISSKWNQDEDPLSSI